MEFQSNDYYNTTLFEINLFDIKNVKINGMRNDNEYKFLTDLIPNHKDDIEKKKIQKVKIMNYSPTNWMLSPPTMNHIIRIFEKNVGVFIKFQWEFKRDYPVNNKNIYGVSRIMLNKDETKTLKDIITSAKGVKKEKKDILIKNQNINTKLVLNGNNKTINYIII